MNEFELIARFFDRDRGTSRAPGVRLGIGDDGALLAPRAGHEIAVSTDLLVAGRHFFDDIDAGSLGWKTLAVNLSDLAAMGARPLAFTLALALPSIDEAWLAAFADGLFRCADAFDCALVGGDTTRGPLTVCVTVIGEVVEGRALRRDGARSGDDVWVSGSVGSASLALERMRALRDAGERDAADTLDAVLRARLERPQPRVALGRSLVGIATACIDVSDGLAQDLGHVLHASGCGAMLDVDRLPLDAELGRVEAPCRRRLALSGGDDYELCFTAPSARREAVERAALDSATRVTRVGTVEAGSVLRLLAGDAALVDPTLVRGFDHFA